jgi:hypothetical protein
MDANDAILEHVAARRASNDSELAGFWKSLLAALASPPGSEYPRE